LAFGRVELEAFLGFALGRVELEAVFGLALGFALAVLDDVLGRLGLAAPDEVSFFSVFLAVDFLRRFLAAVVVLPELADPSGLVALRSHWRT
jgi:hypothetical protein